MANITFSKKSVVLLTIELQDRSDPDRFFLNLLEFLEKEGIAGWLVSAHSGLGSRILSFNKKDVRKVERWLLKRGAKRATKA